MLIAVMFVVASGLVPELVPLARADGPFAPVSQITDRAGALTSAQRNSVQQSLDSLYAKDKLKLFVVYVKDFSGKAPAAWVDESAVLGGMGRRDILLGVATQARQYAVSADQDAGLTKRQLDDVAATAIEPGLRASDWAAAAIGAASGYAAVLAGQQAVAPVISSSAGPAEASSGGGSAGAWIAVLIVLVLLALLVYFFFRRRSAVGAGGGRGGLEPGAPTTAELQAKAGHLLVTTDDAIRTSEQELGFAAAQFGDEAVAPFATAMEQAKTELAAAFKLRQQLDDDIPEDEPTTRSMLQQLCTHCETANKLLDEQAAAFDKLRDLEANAPRIIPQLTASASAAQTRVAAARATLSQLGVTYAPSAVADVAGNADEAATRLAFIQDSLRQASQAVAGGDTSRAAVLVQAAQLADDQVTQLLDGVDRRAGELSEASTALAAALAATEANVAEAAASGAAGSGAGSGLREAAVQAQTVAAQVRGSSGAGPSDPLAALRAVEEANSRLDQALAGAREVRVRQERARAGLEQAVLTARSSIAAASDFITTNRGGVGSTARTRVAEAQRHLDKALALAAAAGPGQFNTAAAGPGQFNTATDAESALREAQQADAMASQAYREAQGDVSAFAAPARVRRRDGLAVRRRGRRRRDGRSRAGRDPHQQRSWRRGRRPWRRLPRLRRRRADGATRGRELRGRQHTRSAQRRRQILTVLSEHRGKQWLSKPSSAASASWRGPTSTPCSTPRRTRARCSIS